MRGFSALISMVMKTPKARVTKEMISDWVLALYEQIEDKVEVDEKELEELCFDVVESAIEKFFNYPDYGNYN